MLIFLESLINDDRANRLACVHQIKGLVDVGQRHGVRDKRCQLDFAAHGVLDHAGQLAAAFDAAKGRAKPFAPRHQLERAGRNLLARAGHANHHRLAPAPVRAFQRGAHHLGVANALKAVVNAPRRHLDNDLLDRLVKVFRVDAIGGTKSARQIEFSGVGVDGDDATGLGQLGTLNHRQANAAQAKHRHAVAFLHFGSVFDRAQPGGHAAAQQADLLGVGIGVDFGQRNGSDYGVFAEGAAAHVVKNWLALVRKARGAIGHQAFALRGAHGDAQVGFARLAEQALAAFGGVERNHMVTRLHAGHAFAHFDDDARAFVAQHGGEDAFGVVTAQREGVGVADAGVGNFDQHFARLRRRDVDFDDLQGFSGFEGDGGFGFHREIF